MRFSVSSPSLRVTIRPCGPDSERPLAKVPQSRRSRTLVRGRARRKWIRIEHAEARRHRACRPQTAMNCQDCGIRCSAIPGLSIWPTSNSTVVNGEFGRPYTGSTTRSSLARPRRPTSHLPSTTSSLRRTSPQAIRSGRTPRVRAAGSVYDQLSERSLCSVRPSLHQECQGERRGSGSNGGQMIKGSSASALEPLIHRNHVVAGARYHR